MNTGVKYKIYTQHVTNDKEKKKYWSPREEYKTKEEAERKAKKSYARYPSKIVEIPKEFKIGFEIYGNKENISGRLIPDEDIFHYGTIVNEDDSFWYVKRAFADDTDDPAFFLKSTIEEKYVTEKFVIKNKDNDDQQKE